ncbi:MULTISPECIES: hypothetical protein [unclassified Serratia (in: enterobacteria)]|uniref:hypothetical protein n=1 Tax=unclassified Serratia (in: enterobacteria) TaxID=2647522 RepID=UPI003076864A
MRHALYFTLILLATLPAANAASCRAGTAAQIGSESGYSRAKAAADAWAQRQNTVSASLGDCLGNISTTITAPTFPNLTDIMNQIGQKICKAARDKINDYVPSTIDPWGDLASTASLSSYRSFGSTEQPQQIIPMQNVVPSPPVDSRGSSFIFLN